MTRRIAHAAQIGAIALALALVPAALAAKGGNSGGGGHHGSGGTSGGSSSLSLAMVTDSNGNGLPNWGDTVTFNVSTTASQYPYVSLVCYQNGTLVLSGSAGFYPSYAWPSERDFTLQSGAWTGGAASCTARLYSADNGSETTLATFGFNVAA
jgi:hypothetical protein